MNYTNIFHHSNQAHITATETLTLMRRYTLYAAAVFYATAVLVFKLGQAAGKAYYAKPVPATVAVLPLKADYSQLGIRELKALAKAAKLPRYGSMTKAQLLASL